MLILNLVDVLKELILRKLIGDYKQKIFVRILIFKKELWKGIST